jgi:tetratricopeptide (TPR) repeat protein
VQTEPRPAAALDQPALELTSVLVALAGEPIDASLLFECRAALGEGLSAGLDSEQKLDRLLTDLADAGLIFRQSGEAGSPIAPRLSALGAAADPDTATALAFLLAAFPGDPYEYDAWPRCEQLMPHLLAAVDRAEAEGLESLDALRLLDLAARYLLAAGRYPQARELLERALGGWRAPSEELLDGDLANTLGCALYELGDRSGAAAELTRALAIHEAFLDPGATEIVWDRIDLSQCLLGMGEKEDALGLLRAAQSEIERGAAGERAACAAQRNLAVFQLQLGESDAARASFELALVRSREVFGEEHPETLETLFAGTLLDEEAGDFAAARRRLEEIAEPLEAALGPGHPQVGALHGALGYVCQQGGALRAARDPLERAIAIAERTLPSDHESRWFRHRRLGEVLSALAEPELAKPNFEQALAISERTVGVEAPRFLEDLAALAAGLLACGESERSRDTYLRVVDLGARVLGPDHPDVVGYRLELGQLYRDRGELSAARKLLEEARQGFAELEDRESEARCRIELSQVLVDAADDAASASAALGRAEDAGTIRASAEATFVSALEDLLDLDLVAVLAAIAEAARHRVPGLALSALERGRALVEEDRQGRLSIAWSWFRYGKACRQRKETEAARDAYEVAVELLADIPSFQGVVVQEIGEMLADLGRVEEALEAYQRAVDYKRAPGDYSEPLDLATSLLSLGRVNAELSRFEDAEAAYEERLEILRDLPESELFGEGVTLHDLAELRQSQDRTEEALELYREAADLKRADGGSSRDLIATLFSYGRLLERRREYDLAEPIYTERVELLRSLGEPYPRGLGVALHDLADVRLAKGNPSEALELYRRAADEKRKFPEHPIDLVTTLAKLGRAQESLGDYEAAERTYDDRLEVIGDLAEAQPLLRGVALHDLADALLAQGRFEEALERYGEAADRKRESEEASPDNLAATLLMMTTTMLRLGTEPDQRAGIASEAVELLRSAESVDPYQLASALVLDADARQALGRGAEAIALYREADENLARAKQTGPLERATLKFHIANILEQHGEATEAVAAREAGRILMLESLDSREVEAEPEAFAALCALCIANGADDIAAEAVDRVRGCLEESPNRDLSLALDKALLYLADQHEENSELDQAILLTEERVERLSSLEPRAADAEGHAEHQLGNLFRANGEKARSIEHFIRAAESRRQADLPRYQAAFSLIAAGKMQLACAEPAAALELAEQAEALIRQEEEPEVEGLVTAVALRAESEHAVGNDEEALASIDRAEELLDAAALPDPFKRAWFKRLAAEALEALGRHEESKAATDAALEFDAEVGEAE